MRFRFPRKRYEHACIENRHRSLEVTKLLEKIHQAYPKTRPNRSQGPGLVDSLRSTFSAAKAMAWREGLPWVGVHHLLGHLNAARFGAEEVEPLRRDMEVMLSYAQSLDALDLEGNRWPTG